MGSSLTFETKAPALHRNTLSCGGDLSWIKKCSINSDGGYSPRIYLVPSAW